MDLAELQDVIDRTYGERDRERGVAPTVAWLAEEFGELAQAVRKGTPAEVEHEFSDVLAWLSSLANASRKKPSETMSSSICPSRSSVSERKLARILSPTKRAPTRTAVAAATPKAMAVLERQ